MEENNDVELRENEIKNEVNNEVKNEKDNENNTNNKKEKKHHKHHKIKKGLIVAIIVIVLFIIGIFGFAIYHAKQVVTLARELHDVSAITQLVDEDGNIDKSAEVDMTIKTKGGYAVIEKTFKDKINEALQLAKNAGELYSEEDIIAILSIDNMKNDGPEFTETKARLQKMKQNGDDYINKFIQLCDKNSLITAIDDKNVNEYYKQLYKNLLFDENTETELNTAIEQLGKTKVNLQEVFDYLNGIITFLSDNKDSWEVQNNKIMFKNQDKLNEYNKIVAAIPTLDE